MQLSPDELVFWQSGVFKLNATIVFTWGIMPGQLHVKPRKKRSRFVRGRPRPSRRGDVCRGCYL